MSEPYWVPLSGVPAVGPVPAARVYRTTAQSISNAVANGVGFDAERFDTDNIHDVVTNSTRLTCRTAGKYLIGCNIEWNPNATGERILWIYLNGGTPIAEARGPNNGATAVVGQIATVLQDMAVGDFVEIYVYQNSGGALNLLSTPNYSPEFWMIRQDTLFGALAPAGGSSAPLVTSLPASPVDGQECILCDSLSNPTYSWHLKYLAARPSNKWLYIGGRPKPIGASPNAVVNTQTQVGSTGNYRNTGTDFVVPVAGSYYVDGSIILDPNGTAGWANAGSFSGAAMSNALNGAAMPFPAAAAGNTMALKFLAYVVGVAAGATIGIAVATTVPGTHKIQAQAVAYYPDALGG